ncbi:MAG: hypothetical protein L0J77_13990 [Marinobacter sp.]|nr:hypothetical protein [Marinobacter sp.]
MAALTMLGVGHSEAIIALVWSELAMSAGFSMALNPLFTTARGLRGALAAHAQRRDGAGG